MWKLKDKGIKTVSELVQKNTGMTKEELEDFEIHSDIPELDPVADEFRYAAEHKIPMHFVTDYDVDGQGCSYIADVICTDLGIPHTIYIPQRFKDGYGLNPQIVDLYNDGYLVTCDNGIVAFDAVQKAKDKGMKVIIIDHHAMSKDGRLPNADLIVDPSEEAIPGKSTAGEVCATGVMLFLARKLLSNQKSIDHCFCVAALATICDVMPLTGTNRAIVKQGLDCLMDKTRRTLGMGALLRATGSGKNVTSVGVSFGIGPAINACSRLEGTEVEVAEDPASKTSKTYNVIANARMIFDLFTANFRDYKAADAKAREIKVINDLRKVMKFEQAKEAFKIIERDLLYSNAPISVYSPKFHLGLVGIIAGQITEKYGVPAIALTNDPKSPENIKGSARSIEKINIKSVLDECADDLGGYGGHAGAAGLSMPRANFEKFVEDSNRVLEDEEFETPEPTYDFEITEAELESTLMELDKGQPYGAHNPEPVFLIRNFKPYPIVGTKSKLKYVGNEHVILQGKTCEAPAFFLREKFDTEIHDMSYLDILCTLDWTYDRFGNKYPQIMIKDVREAETPPVIKHSSLWEMFSTQVNNEEQVTA